MELVPILSTIILVGTIATFILAVFAYILYKIRERRATEGEQQQQAMPEPHVLMAPQQGMLAAPQQQAAVASTYMAPTSTTPPQQQQAVLAEASQRPMETRTEVRTRVERPSYQPATPAASSAPANSLFWEYTDEGFVPVTPQQQAAAPQQRAQSEKDDDFAWL